MQILRGGGHLTAESETPRVGPGLPAVFEQAPSRGPCENLAPDELKVSQEPDLGKAAGAPRPLPGPLLGLGLDRNSSRAAAAGGPQAGCRGAPAEPGSPGQEQEEEAQISKEKPREKLTSECELVRLCACGLLEGSGDGGRERWGPLSG